MIRRGEDVAVAPVVRNDVASTERCWSQLLLLAATMTPAIEDEALLPVAARAVTLLSERVVTEIIGFRWRTGPRETLLLRGLIPPDADFGPTPSSAAPQIGGVEVKAATVCLLGVALLLGEPYGFRTFYDGRLVQHVVPVRGMESTQTGESSKTMLDWHVEDGFTEARCHYFMLLCLRGDSSAATLVAPAADLNLAPSVVRTLREPRFVLRPDSAHGAVAAPLTPMSVLTGPVDAPEIAYDAHYLSPASPEDGVAGHALERLRAALDASRRSVTLEAGDLLVVDNRRAVHARSPFEPSNDGSDRWLLRTMIWSSLPEFQRRPGRVVDLAVNGRRSRA
jgi:L-asparagine oxygenase